MFGMNNLRSIDLNLLVVLDALLAEQHLSRAAARLNMSQPAMSHALGRLRLLLGDPLFRREGGQMLPTLRALALAGPLTEAMAQIRSVLGPEGFDPATEHVFRLAMSDYGAGLLLPGLMQRLRSEAPGIELIITQHSREAMIAGVTDGTLDLALGVFPAVPAPLEQELLLEDRYVCVVDPAHQPPLPDGLTRDAFRAAAHAHVAVQGEFATELDLALDAQDGPRHVALVLPHWGIAPQVIPGTDLILTVARRSLPLKVHPLTVLEPPFPLPLIPFSALYARRRRADPALRWLLARIHDVVEPAALQVPP